VDVTIHSQCDDLFFRNTKGAGCRQKRKIRGFWKGGKSVRLVHDIESAPVPERMALESLPGPKGKP
jgi:hypothetical protein